MTIITTTPTVPISDIVAGYKGAVASSGLSGLVEQMIVRYSAHVTDGLRAAHGIDLDDRDAAEAVSRILLAVHTIADNRARETGIDDNLSLAMAVASLQRAATASLAAAYDVDHVDLDTLTDQLRDRGGDQ